MLNFEVNKKVKIPVSERWLKGVVAAFKKAAKIKAKKNFSLAFVGKREMKKLNRLGRGKNQVTDILSFAEEGDKFIGAPEEKNYLGEIVICVPQARKQVKEFNSSFQGEVARLLIHGLAHLVGYEHEKIPAREQKKMFLFEERVMSIFIKTKKQKKTKA